MTRQRNDEHSTEFGLWLRQQSALESADGYVATNIDFLWSNYKTGQWLLIEEKRYGSKLTYSQRELFLIIHRSSLVDPKYCGFFFIVFEHTLPSDGQMWINNYEADGNVLIKLLRFDPVTVLRYKGRVI